MADTLIELQNNPQAAEMPHADWLSLLIDREATFRDNRRLSRRLATARLRQAAAVENVDYRMRGDAIAYSSSPSPPPGGCANTIILNPGVGNSRI